MNKIYGYARCSTNEDKQDIQRQIRELKAAGAQEVIFEFEHGDALIKQNLRMLLDNAVEGDTIKLKKLCLVIVGSISVDCRSGNIDPMSQAFIQMSAVFAELELSIIRARVRSSMANARAKGAQIGRKPTTKDDIPAAFYKHYPAFIAGKLNVSELARVCGLSRPTVYKHLKLI